LRTGAANSAPNWGQVALTSDVTGALPVANGGTGATTAAAALTALGAMPAKQIDIPYSADLNTYLKAGFFGQPLSAGAASGQNYPVAQAGTLLVESTGTTPNEVTQTYTRFDTGATFKRVYYSNGNPQWTEWRTLAYTDSPAFTGTPTAPTANAGTNTTQIATTAFVAAAVPAGKVDFYAKNAAPTGYLKCNGAAVSRTTYAALFAAIDTVFGAGDGSTTFNLPDLRGEFIRGFDDGRGVDSGRAFGSAQGDAIRNIVGSFSAVAGGFVSITGSFCSKPVSTNHTNTSTNSSSEGIGFDASLTVPTANENRPRSIALLACIKF